MPAIKLFNRRTLLGGDDLQIPSVLTISVRLIQTVLLIVPLLAHVVLEGSSIGWSSYLLYDPSSSSSCRHSHFFPLLLSIYTLASATYCVVSIVVEYRLAKRSSVGTPTQPELRHPHVQHLMELKLVPLAITNALVFGTGLWALSCARTYYHCRDTGTSDNGAADLNADLYDDYLDEDPDAWIRQGGDYYDSLYAEVPTLVGRNAWWAAYLVLLASQCAEVFVSVLSIVPLLRSSENIAATNRRPSLEEMALDNPSLLHPHPPHELAERMWHDRCTSFCRCLSVSSCFLFGGRNIETGDYGDVSRLLADYFETGGVLDVVPSDIAVGFAMLRRVQRERILEARRLVREEEKSSSDDDGPLLSQPSRDGMTKKAVQDSLFPPENDIGVGLGLDACDATSTMIVAPALLLPRLPEPSDALLLTPTPSGNVGSTAVSFHMTHRGSGTFFYEPQRRRVLSRNDEYDRGVMADGARFARHALAIYTWVLYVYMNPMTGGCRLLSRQNNGRDCGCCPSLESDCDQDESEDERRRPNRRLDETRSLNDYDLETGRSRGVETGRIIVGDNLCQVHKSALLLHAGLHESDLMYAQLNSTFTESPYCIVLDHKWRSVVVAIRGTLSLEDCIKDVLVTPEPLDELGREFGFDGEGESCHSGVLGCAWFVYRDLQSHGILKRLLLGNNALYPEYTLRIVGHSLGAGCANILSFMLRRTYPTLQCLCYSPPGAFISWRLANESKEFCTSFVLDCDLVPRLAVETMEHLRNEVLELIGRLKVPKIEVARHVVHPGGLLSCKTCVDEDLEDADADHLAQSNADMLHDRGEIPTDTNFARQLEQFKSIQRERKRVRAETRAAVKLYPPGNIVHLVKTGERKTCGHGLVKCLTCGMTNVGSEYTPVWAENDDFNEIVVSPTMGTDHFPNRVCLEIEGVAKAFGLDTTLGSRASSSGEGGSVA